MPVPLVCRNYFCFYIETEAGTKQAFDKRVLLNSLSPRCFHHQPASPPKFPVLGTSTPNSPHSQESESSLTSLYCLTALCPPYAIHA